MRPATLVFAVGCVSLVSGFSVVPTLCRSPAITRAPAPKLVIGRVRKFIANRRSGIQTEDGDAVTKEPPLPDPVVLPKDPVTGEREISPVDKLLVKFGMKEVDECEIVEEGENLMEQIKCAGRAGIISYVIWEWVFWIGAGGIAAFAFYQATGGWPDLSDQEDQGKVAASAFALVNVARFAVPLRIGLALSTTPWVDENIVQAFMSNDEDGAKEE